MKKLFIGVLLCGLNLAAVAKSWSVPFSKLNTITECPPTREASADSLGKIPVRRHRFIVIAHRGDHERVPENTLESFQKAIDKGVDYVELDLRTTRDSVLVIMHDDTIDRMTNGKGKVSGLDYAEIKKLRIRAMSPDSNHFYTVPTFESVLKICKHKIHIYLDFKNASVAQTYKMIEKYGMEKEVIVYINAPHQYLEWRAQVPLMPLMVSLPDEVKTKIALANFLKSTPVSLLDGNYSDYSPEVLAAVKKSSILAWPDIQSPTETENWQKAIEMGFKGLQTNLPEEMIIWLERKGLR